MERGGKGWRGRGRPDPHLLSSRSFLVIKSLSSSSRHNTRALASGTRALASGTRALAPGEQMPSLPRSCRVVFRAGSSSSVEIQAVSRTLVPKATAV